MLILCTSSPHPPEGWRDQSRLHPAGIDAEDPQINLLVGPARNPGAVGPTAGTQVQGVGKSALKAEKNGIGHEASRR